MKAELITTGQAFSHLLKVKIGPDRSVVISKEHIFEKPSEALSMDDDDDDFDADEVDNTSTSFVAKQLINSKMLAHDDFVTAMNNLKFHMLCLTEVFREEDYSAKDVEKIMGFAGKPTIPKPLKEIMDCFEVRGLHMSGDPDKRGFIITGVHLTRKKSKKTAINTSRMLFDGEALPYKFNNIISQVIENINDEVELYLRGKCQWDGQLALNLGEQGKTIPITEKTGTSN